MACRCPARIEPGDIVKGAPQMGDARTTVAAVAGHLDQPSAQTLGGTAVYRGIDSRTIAVNRTRAAERLAAANPPLVNTSPGKRALLAAIRQRHPGHSSGTLAIRVATALRAGSLSTLEARLWLDVCSPAVVVHGLRKAGEQIAMVWVRQAGVAGGKAHRIGSYSLTHDVDGARHV